MSVAAEILDIVRPFHVTDLHRLVEAGVLDPEERLELIGGVLVTMAAHSPQHASLVSRIGWRLSRLEERQAALIREQKPLVLSERDELCPDVCAVQFREDHYANVHPSVAETFLVVEVADASLGTDRQVKLPCYAQAQVLEVWIVNIPGRQLEVYREPAGGRYQLSQTLAAGVGGRVAPAAFPDVELDLADLFRFV